ncbi:MAG: DUF302 domain-containing protein [Polyangiales bacterium]
MNTGLWKSLASPFDDALARLPDALAAEGFGVITRIDMRETMRQKLGVEFRRYQILGACNPKLALAALQADARVGAMLPCNVVLYEDDAGRAVLGAVDPMQSIGADGAPALREVAAEVRARLARVVDAVA